MGAVADFFRKLLPREEKFYVTINELAQLSAESLDNLAKFIGAGVGSPAGEAPAQRISEIRQKSKSVCSALSEQIAKSFITPFDREDMLEFATNVHRNIKLCDKIKARIQRHKLEERNQDFTRMINVMQRHAVTLQELVDHMNKNKLLEAESNWRTLRELEQEADDLLDALVTELVNTENLSIQEAFVRKDTYQMFERLSDAYSDAGTFALQIVMKHT